MQVRGPWRPRGSGVDRPVASSGPKSPTPWRRRARRGCRGVVRCRGAAVRGGVGAQQCGAAQGRGAGLRRGAAWGPERGGAGEWGLRWGHGVHVGGGGGGCRLVGGCASEGDGGAVSSAAECHRAADRAEERLRLAKVGRGARGAQRFRGGRGQQWSLHPAWRGRILPSIIHGGKSWWRRGGVPHRPLAAKPDRDGPRRRDTGGGGGAGHRGSGAWVPDGCGPARGRPGGPLGCGW